jgi:hypothetical protein
MAVGNCRSNHPNPPPDTRRSSRLQSLRPRPRVCLRQRQPASRSRSSMTAIGALMLLNERARCSRSTWAWLSGRAPLRWRSGAPQLRVRPHATRPDPACVHGNRWTSLPLSRARLQPVDVEQRRHDPLPIGSGAGGIPLFRTQTTEFVPLPVKTTTMNEAGSTRFRHVSTPRYPPRNLRHRSRSALSGGAYPRGRVVAWNAQQRPGLRTHS